MTDKFPAIRSSLPDCAIRSSERSNFAVIRPSNLVRLYLLGCLLKLYSRHRSYIKIGGMLLTITPDNTLKRWIVLYAFSRRVFTHAVFLLCVHPATMHVNGCCNPATPFTVRICCLTLGILFAWTTFM